MNLEWLLFGLLCGLGVFRLLTCRRSRKMSRVLALAALGLAAGTATAWSLKNARDVNSHQRLSQSIPREGRPDGYVSSDKCQSCHPNEYATWHRTFHRTMTQVAARDSIVGNFEDVNLDLGGKSYRLERRGDEFWVEMEDPEWRPDPSNSPAPRVRRRIGLLTGSHHMQAY